MPPACPGWCTRSPPRKFGHALVTEWRLYVIYALIYAPASATGEWFTLLTTTSTVSGALVACPSSTRSSKRQDRSACRDRGRQEGRVHRIGEIEAHTGPRDLCPRVAQRLGVRVLAGDLPHLDVDALAPN